MNTTDPKISAIPTTPVSGNVDPKPTNKITDSFQKISALFFKNITLISIGAFIILAIGLVAFFYNQNQKLKQMLAKVSEPSPAPTISNDPLASWRLFKNESGKYQFKIPQEWNQLVQSDDFKDRFVFQSGDGLYRFTVDTEANKNKATGKPYNSLDEYIGLPYTVKSLNINGVEARQPLPRAGSENYDKVNFFSPNKNYIYSLELLVGDGSQSDHRVTIEAIRIGSDIFDKIAGTFKFIEPIPSATASAVNDDTVSSPSAKACTLEAKICPDGSSVGRVGPDCEFAPCPSSK